MKIVVVTERGEFSLSSKSKVSRRIKRVSKLMSEHGLVAKGTRKADRKPQKKALRGKGKCPESGFFSKVA